jgi:hypothetical protein
MDTNGPLALSATVETTTSSSVAFLSGRGAFLKISWAILAVSRESSHEFRKPRFCFRWARRCLRSQSPDHVARVALSWYALHIICIYRLYPEIGCFGQHGRLLPPQAVPLRRPSTLRPHFAPPPAVRPKRQTSAGQHNARARTS